MSPRFCIHLHTNSDSSTNNVRIQNLSHFLYIQTKKSTRQLIRLTRWRHFRLPTNLPTIAHQLRHNCLHFLLCKNTTNKVLKSYVVRAAFSSSSPVSHYQLESACQSLFDVATLFHLRWCSVALTQALICQALPLPADNTNTSSLAPPLPFLILDNHSWYDKHFHQLIEK